MSLLQNGDDDMDVAFSQGGTHFKDWAVAPPVINFFQKIFLNVFTLT